MQFPKVQWLRFLLTIAVLCSAPLLSHADEAPASATCGCNPLTQAFTDQLRAVELARYNAMTSNNLDALSTLLGDDLVYAHSTGVAQTKPQLLSDLREGKIRYRKIYPLNQTVRWYGEIAIVNGLGKFDLTAAGREVSTVLAFTAVYMQRGETLKHWELISWHSSAAPQENQNRKS